MKKLVFVLLLGAALSARAGDFEDSLRGSFEEVKTGVAAAPAADPRCRPETDADPKLYSNAFHWGYSLEELKAAYAKAYASPERLPKRAYWNGAAGRFELPYMKDRGGAVTLAEPFVRAVAKHIENAYAAGYIDAVFFPDMGHSHFYIPEAHWEKKYGDVPVAGIGAMYAELFKDPRLMVLYHTAEQLKTREKDGTLVADPRTRFRFETRNIVGANTAAGPLKIYKNPESKANTVVELPGFHEWSAGFNLSANENGCFSFQHGGKTVRFDLSLDDLEPAPGTGSAD